MSPGGTTCCPGKRQQIPDLRQLNEIRICDLDIDVFVLPGGVVGHMNTVAAQAEHGQYIGFQ